MAVREDRPQAGRRSRFGYAEGGFGAGTQKLSKRSRRIRVKENEAWDFPCEQRWYREIFALCTDDVQRAFLYSRKFQRGGI